MAAASETKKLADAMRKTLNLPHTAFPMRANAAVREPQLHARCVTQLYEAQLLARQNAEPFYLHDGPPFANGSLHMGHLLNKVLKDIINRYKLMRGHRIEYVPGWDCHGLPIEVKALGQLQARDAAQLAPVQVRKLSRELATKAIAEQRQDYLRWGILADWSGKPGSVYRTMDPTYEAKQYDVLKQMVQDGLIFRGFKPVYWSPSSRTALAEAELEYAEDHVSHAAYIAFPFHSATTATAQALLNKYKDKSLFCVVWTTTPWTIPANQALCVNASVEYAVVLQPSSGRHFLVAKDLVENLATQLSSTEAGAEPEPLEIVETVAGEALAGSLFQHPLADRRAVVLVGDHVTVDAGTGIVHTAPGHGQDDYFAWLAYHGGDSSAAEILCPVDNEGRFTQDAGHQLHGLEVLSDGNKAVLEMLTQSGNLLHVAKYKHRYPYDWRTKKPVILRATAQWFAKLDGLHAVGKRALEDHVQTFPSSSRRRLEATLSSRHEWCISRQRAWGLPIPVFYHKDTNEPLITNETISYLQDIVRTYETSDGHKGSDCWWDLSVQELLPPAYKDQASQYVKGTDTLDVWFDSGSSWHTVLPDVASGKLKQAHVYLEGSDQHRGWFQSSLLTSVAMQQAAPYKHVITHGFALDERGSKMSKSLGNTIVPKDFIDGGEVLVPHANPTKKPKAQKIPAYGVDVLRYWVASTDYSGDVNFGPIVIAKVSDALRKVRNTARFLLANLNDFQPERDAVPYEQLPSVDQYMLHVLLHVNQQITEGYESYAFNRVQSALAHFISSDLSAFYMEACKDRLYCDGTTSASRRAAQTVLWHTLESVTRAIAPVVCHTAEDIRLHWQSQVQQCELDQVAGSVFLEDDAWLPASRQWHNAALASQWAAIRQLRVDVNRVVETMRAANVVGSQLECNVYVVSTNARVVMALGPLAEKSDATLENVLLCSGVEIVSSETEIDAKGDERFVATTQLMLDSEGGDKVVVQIVVTRAKGHKCPRCWKYAVEVDAEETKLCSRCAHATNLTSVADLAAALVRE
jgi:isoleucyl-tRNA synthetase